MNLNVNEIQKKYNIDDDLMAQIVGQFAEGYDADHIAEDIGVDETTMITPNDVLNIYQDMLDSDEVMDIVNELNSDSDQFDESKKMIKESGFIEDDGDDFDWNDPTGEVYNSDPDETKHAFSKGVIPAAPKSSNDNGTLPQGTKVLVMMPDMAPVKIGQVITIDGEIDGYVTFTKGKKQYAIPTENVKPLVQESNIRRDADPEGKNITKQYIRYMNEERDHNSVCQGLAEKYNMTQEDIEYTLSETLDEEGNEFYFNMATRKSNQPVPYHRAISDQEDPASFKTSYMKYEPGGRRDYSNFDYEVEDEDEEEFIKQNAFKYIPRKPIVTEETDDESLMINDDELEEIADDILVELIKDSKYKNAYDTLEDAVFAVISLLDLEEKLGEEGALTVAEIIKQKYEAAGSNDEYEMDETDLGFEGDEDFTPADTASEFEVDRKVVECVKKLAGSPRQWTMTERHFIARFYDKPFSQSTINEMKSANHRFDKIKEEGDYTLLYFKR